MKYIISVIFAVGLVFYLFSSCTSETNALTTAEVVSDESWKAQWIAPQTKVDSANGWICFRKEISIDQLPDSSVTAKIAVDSKYWLWINGKMVVREGGLKRGPTPQDTYYDEVGISENLREGQNVVAVLVHYFGKDGFSHKSSGQAGLLLDVQAEGIEILTDSTWKAWVHPAFGNTVPPHPNFRLPESNIQFDARRGDFSFVADNFDDSELPTAQTLGVPPVAPWNQLVKRPIPQWKDFGLKDYSNAPSFPFISTGDTVIVQLPYNAQVTPYFEIEALAGGKIDIRTDHYFGGGPPNVRAVYITREGRQSYENLGWINGHHVRYHFPKGIKVLGLKYRESGYDTEFAGSFTCNDLFYNQLWEKARRTLYITMRDTYMDCPDRERAQWWGDAVLESGETFYALDRKADLLTRKGILEIMNWQRPDGTIFSPVPAGNWDKELPGQMLASVGYYGFWNYYWHSGDLETIRDVYEPVKKYLSVWKLKDDGTVQVREGGWTWGDWGEHQDVPLLINTQYYLALKGLQKMAEVLGHHDETDSVVQQMKAFKSAFNQAFWQDSYYQSLNHQGETDDRPQGLAVVAGLADEDKYEAIYQVLQCEWHASPYMEKYVLEALFQMGYAEYALERMKKRFAKMVDHPTITTLWEGWGIGSEGYGGGTTNHAWSGGGLTLLSQYVAGVSPTAPGYKTFQVKPQLGSLKQVKGEVPSIRGKITVEIEVAREYRLSLEVPEQTVAKVYIPDHYASTHVNGKELDFEREERYRVYEIPTGSYQFLSR
ncbi:alpha-L-rhamnosidase C-terminal domain-containing protein [Tunicatimonas pelagia]|uniref:alpha-L-rhamnosidase-related protein n=1 Tax=Tunicatimonas pelagia TaxID=931531 RepID=UPI002665B0CF|nr:alpha-L-rhamnosidase C-terminal domain-containing protein [Tunicatimonas pelagia]WKN45603.1 alpha-L-rhamnosidase C-terminal domain-containing protein [Tunicatimonas pelagia]